MKIKLFALGAICAALCAAAFAFSGCMRQVDYSAYVSERRTNVFLYEDDATAVKIYCSQKEQPYAADGFKGEMSDLVEIFVTLPKVYDSVEVSAGTLSGEMSYQAVEKRFYLSLSAPEFATSSVDVTLTFDGESKTFSALSVKDSGIMNCDEAVKCVAEHAKELFEGLTANGLFDGEIFVRLLYDDGCYYYVGVCDKTKHISAFLIDGEKGKIISTKELQG